MLNRLFLAVALTLTGACASTPVLPAGDAIGEPMEPKQTVTFATVHANPSEYFEQTLLVEATATAVCVKAGCWLQIEDSGSTAMVRWESGCGGKYMFPEDIAGRRILIQGSFYPKELTEADAEHMQEEAGTEVEIERDGYEFNASAVLVLADDK